MEIFWQAIVIGVLCVPVVLYFHRRGRRAAQNAERRELLREISRTERR